MTHGIPKLKMKPGQKIFLAHHYSTMGVKQNFFDDDLSGYSTKSSIDLDAVETSKYQFRLLIMHKMLAFQTAVLVCMS